MTGRSLVIQGALALAGLSVAYATWQREPDRADGEVIVVDATKNELGRVHFEDDNTSVELERRSDGDGSAVWLQLLDKTPAPVPAAAKAHGTGAPASAASPAPAPRPRPLRDLRGDEPATRTFEQFAPLRSARAFGTLDAAKLKELGLDAPKRKLQVTARGQTRDFVIGSPASATGESYLRDVKDGRVYLMPRALLSDLQGAGYRLVDRRLHAFKIADVNRIVVTASGKSRELVLTNGQNPTAYKLAPAGTPDKPDEQARNWHDKIWRLYPLELLGKGEVPADGTPKVAARIEYFDGRKPVGWVELGSVEKPDKPEPSSTGAGGGAGASAADARSSVGKTPAPGPTELYARSEHTSGWIRLANDPTPLTDTEKLAAGP
jgi:hypothetical protein